MTSQQAVAAVLAAALALQPLAPAYAQEGNEQGERELPNFDEQLDLSTEPVPFLRDEDIPERVGPIIELGRGINQTGKLDPGIEIPTGAVWQPALWVYGSWQTAFTSMDGPIPPPGGQNDVAELATRLNVFANLQLTGTERVLMHVRPLDHKGKYTRFQYSPGETEEHVEDNLDLRLFFAEAEFGELFPQLDPDDSGRLDIGLSLGLQPLFFQNGILLNDNVVAAGIAQKSIILPGTSGARAAFMYGWDDIHMGNTMRDKNDGAELYGLFMEADVHKATLVELDVGYTKAREDLRGDQYNAGLSFTTHRGGGNYALRANISRHFNNEAALEALADPDRGPTTVKLRDDYDGALITGEYSREVSPNRDLVYFNAFRAIGSFAPLARNAQTAGPLTIIGITYAGVGWGAYRPALLPRALDSAGFAMGYQKFFDAERANLVLELAGRADLRADHELGNGDGNGGMAAGLRFQRKFWNRFMWQVDGHYARYDAETDGDDEGWGIRSEIRVNF